MYGGSLDTLGRTSDFVLAGSTLKKKSVRRGLDQRVTHKDHVHPQLRQWLADSSGSLRKSLIVSFRDTVRMPRFPEPNMQLPRAGNGRALNTADSLVKSIRGRRAADHAADSTDLVTNFNAVVQRTYWLIQAMLVEMPLDSVLPLSNRPRVVYIEPRYVTASASCAGTPSFTGDVAGGRSQIGSDPYFDLGLAYGYVSVLDGGVLASHKLFEGTPSRIGRHGDCRHGGTDCITPQQGFDPSDGDPNGHGTSVAAIISGNASLGAEHRGVTSATLDCFRVANFIDPIWELDQNATVLALEGAIENLNRTIVASIGHRSPSWAAYAAAADNAFGAGAAVIVANGNRMAATDPVMAPAIAHRVLGIGAYDVWSAQRLTADYSARGPAEDGRIKPDLEAPTGVITAGCMDDPADPSDDPNVYLQPFDGTSGAAPFAGGAAILWRNWIAQTKSEVRPGLVYAFMIMSGTRVSGEFDNVRGAGWIEMPSCGYAWFGNETLTPGGENTFTTKLEVGWDGRKKVAAAVWWPEGCEAVGGEIVDVHRVVTLRLLTPSGTTFSDGESEREGSHGLSVFQRVSETLTTGELPKGDWTLEIKLDSDEGPPQDIYWAVCVTGDTPVGALQPGTNGEDGEDDDGRSFIDNLRELIMEILRRLRWMLLLLALVGLLWIFWWWRRSRPPRPPGPLAPPPP
jgi:hypothetical protein